MLKKKWTKGYFSFTRNDRIGAFVVLAAIGGSILLPRLLAPKQQTTLLKADPVLTAAMDTLQKRDAVRKPYTRNYEPDYSSRYEPVQAAAFTNGELFSFDPNTIAFNDWRRLGLNERTSKTILKYVSKGGKFYKPEDLLRIWSMPEGFYDRVKDYIKITSVTRNYPAYEKTPFIREERKPMTVDINAADTSAFIALPGIGGKLSARIVNFRNKLGGFYSVDQVGETYGVPDSTFQKIKSRLQVDEGNIRKMNVNMATKDELKVHPYIRWNLANAIVEYRNQHGAFKTLEELKNIALVDEVTFEKIAHYLSL